MTSLLGRSAMGVISLLGRSAPGATCYGELFDGLAFVVCFSNFTKIIYPLQFGRCVSPKNSSYGVLRIFAVLRRSKSVSYLTRMGWIFRVSSMHT